MITTLHLGLSYKCNMSCSHCYVNKERDVLSMPQYREFISLLSRHGLLVVMYTYGEPLLSDKLIEIAQFVHSLGISQTVLTNGWYVENPKIDELSVCGINNYNVSLDSTIPEKHDANRGCRGAYNHAVKAIRLLKNKQKNVGIGVTVTRNNVMELSSFLDFAQKEGIDRISFLAQRSKGHISGPLSHQYVQIFNDAIAGKSPVKNVFFHDPRLLSRIQSLYTSTTIDATTYERWQQMNSCHMGYSISLEPNGNVSSCNLCRECPICNISSLSGYEALMEERIENIHEHFICCSMLSSTNN